MRRGWTGNCLRSNAPANDANLAVKQREHGPGGSPGRTRGRESRLGGGVCVCAVVCVCVCVWWWRVSPRGGCGPGRRRMLCGEASRATTHERPRKVMIVWIITSVIGK